MDLQGKIINFLGDSITEGSGASDKKTRGFVGVIESRFGAIVRNYGIGGTRLAEQQKKDERRQIDFLDFCSRFAKMDDEADIVCVFGGTNDYGHGDAPFGTFDDRTPNTFFGACHVTFGGLVEKYPGKTVFVVTPLHRIGEDVPTAEGKRPLIDYVNAIRQVAEYYSLPVCDLFATSGLQPAVSVIQETFMPDGLHPSDVGHALLAEKIAAFIHTL